MKLLLFLLFALICVGYLVMQREVESSVKAAIENNTAVLGMNVSQVKKSLGEPLASKQTRTFWGEEIVMTFADSNEITFWRGKATKIQKVELSPALVEVKKAVTAQANREKNTTPEPKRGEWMWKGYKNPLDTRAPR